MRTMLKILMNLLTRWKLRGLRKIASESKNKTELAHQSEQDLHNAVEIIFTLMSKLNIVP
jgi:hypothetical protein